MKSKTVTPKELYNIVQAGQLFYLFQDDEGTINNPCLHFVLYVDRKQDTVKITSLISEYCLVFKDLWSKDEAIFLNENRLICLLYN
jgi:hypothetical protein